MDESSRWSDWIFDVTYSSVPGRWMGSHFPELVDPERVDGAAHSGSLRLGTAYENISITVSMAIANRTHENQTHHLGRAARLKIHPLPHTIRESPSGWSTFRCC